MSTLRFHDLLMPEGHSESDTKVEQFCASSRKEYYERNRRVMGPLLLVTMIVLYGITIYDGTEYPRIMALLCFGTLIINILFSTMYLYQVCRTQDSYLTIYPNHLVRPKFNTAQFIFLTRSIVLYNLLVHFIRIYFARDGHSSVVCSAMGILFIATIPTRPLDAKWCVVPSLILSFGTPLQVYIMFGNWKESFSILAFYLISSHILNDSIFSVVYKHQQISELSQELDSALKVKRDFVSNISHELRGPLLGLGISLELLNETSLNEEQKTHLDTLISCSSILQSFIENVLLYSNLDEKRETPIFEQICIRTFLRTIYRKAKKLIDTSNISFALVIEDSIPEKLTGDSDQLKRMLTNLLSNAINACGEEGKVVLRVGLEKTIGNEVWISFAVEDNGCGIPEDKSHLLFTPFHQLKDIQDRKTPTLGLGLTICKAIVTSLGGTISFFSSTDEKNHGSTFCAIVPLKVEPGIDALGNSVEMVSELIIEHEETEQSPSCNSDVVFNRSRINIVVADDNLICRNVLTRTLGKLGYNIVKAVMNGKELVDFVCSENNSELPDVILTDYHMPEMLGDEAASHIRKTYPDMKIVLLTGAIIDNEEIPSSIKSYVNRILFKPIKSKELDNAIFQLLNQEGT